MSSTAIYLRFRPHRHRHLITSSLHFSSSSSSSNSDNNPSQSYFDDVKSSLKQSTSSSPQQQQPSRRPSFLHSNPNSQPKPASLEEIRKNLSEYRRSSSPPPPQSSPPVLSFQELYKRNAMPKPDSRSGSGSSEPIPLDSIRTSLKNIRLSNSPDTRPKTPFNLNLNLNLRGGSGNEVPINNNNNIINKGSVVSNETKTDFVRGYGYIDLGNRLRKLRRVNDKKSEFSLAELNERLKKVREMDEKEMESTNGMKFSHLRESLAKLQLVDDTKSLQLL